jgi:uncharacterized protein (TIGR02145 family)
MTAVIITTGAMFGAASAQRVFSGKPTVAVYIDGGDPTDRDFIVDAIETYLTKNEKYDVIKLDAIKAIFKEHIRQGGVDTKEVAKYGENAGAEWVCYVKITERDRTTYISTSMVDVETKITKAAQKEELPRDVKLLDFIRQLIGLMLAEGGSAAAKVQPTYSTTYNTAPQFGSVYDRRDGKTYKTVKIGKQTWMAENLNYKTTFGSWCYDNVDKNCERYGRLYKWEKAREVCPYGYHLPTKSEWQELIDATGGGSALKSRSGWDKKDDGTDGNGTDRFGFSALPGGMRLTGVGSATLYAGREGHWWTATVVDYDYASVLIMRSYYDGGVGGMNYHKNYGTSVRCVAD